MKTSAVLSLTIIGLVIVAVLTLATYQQDIKDFYKSNIPQEKAVYPESFIPHKSEIPSGFYLIDVEKSSGQLKVDLNEGGIFNNPGYLTNMSTVEMMMTKYNGNLEVMPEKVYIAIFGTTTILDDTTDFEKLSPILWYVYKFKNDEEATRAQSQIKIAGPLVGAGCEDTRYFGEVIVHWISFSKSNTDQCNVLVKNFDKRLMKFSQ